MIYRWCWWNTDVFWGLAGFVYIRLPEARINKALTKNQPSAKLCKTEPWREVFRRWAENVRTDLLVHGKYWQFTKTISSSSCVQHGADTHFVLLP